VQAFLLKGWEFFGKTAPIVRALFYRAALGLPFRRVGSNLKIRGGSQLSLGKSVAVGNGCWLEAVTQYKGHRYEPTLRIGNHVSISDWTHISAAHAIDVGDGCLIGSKVYIGDHTHGQTGAIAPDTIPADRPLENLAAVRIGPRTWIGDGAVILAGTRIAADSIVGANSVVRIQVDRSAVIAGVPGKVVRYLD
jgi:acetyltransferase-like isoleucine patch superfamily enzyme